MAGVFPRDVWMLLFRDYLDFNDSAIMFRVSRRMLEFMRSDQQYACKLRSKTKRSYHAGLKESLVKMRKTHSEQLSVIEKRYDQGKGTCTMCGLIIKLSRLGKHQRAHLLKNGIKPNGWVAYYSCDNAVPCDKCDVCEMIRPTLNSNLHQLTCPRWNATEWAACEWCGLRRFKGDFRLGENTHYPTACPMRPKFCSSCCQNVPAGAFKFHLDVCAFKCKKLRCQSKATRSNGYCSIHVNTEMKRCSVMIAAKIARQCSRQAAPGHKVCTQHLRMKMLLQKP